MSFLVGGRTPGERTRIDGTEHVICAVPNSFEIHLTVPLGFYENVVRASKVLVPCWPLGLYVIFTIEGATIGVFGRTKEGVLTNALTNVTLDENTATLGGPDIWRLWKVLRAAPAELVKANLLKLTEATNEVLDGPS